LIGDQDDQHVLEQIVVERTAGLRDEKRQETPLAQQPVLIRLSAALNAGDLGCR
jgi:hypothetical protein